MSSELDIIFNPSGEFAKIYGREPGRLIDTNFNELIRTVSIDPGFTNILKTKLYNQCRKVNMLHIAGEKTLECEKDFIVTQDRTCPCLIWEDEINLLYNIEAMILFARSALDIGAYLYGVFLLSDTKLGMDSFNKFSKLVLSRKGFSDELLRILTELNNDKTSWFRILCGTEKGRSVRDKVAHQTIFKIDYLETSPNSEREYCHVIIDNFPILLETFITHFRKGLIEYILRTEEIIMQRLSTEDS